MYFTASTSGHHYSPYYLSHDALLDKSPWDSAKFVSQSYMMPKSTCDFANITKHDIMSLAKQPNMKRF